MKHFKLFTLLIISTMGLFSCKDIIAEDITEATPVLILPALGDTIMNNPVNFKWEPVIGATKYRLQVVKPSFSAISEFVLDTIVSGTNFYYALDSSAFELKLSALNGGYTSKTLGPVPFWVGISPTANNSTVLLQLPTDGAFVNDAFNGPFSWQGLSGALSYEFSLRKGSVFATGNIIHSQNNIVTNNFTLPVNVVLSEGDYNWGVKAYTFTGETYFSTRSFSVDVNLPNVPVLNTPANMSFLSSGNTVFTWSGGTDTGTIQAPVHALVEVASDIAFTSIVHSTDLINPTTTFNLVPGTYYWRVQQYDEAGNASNYSTTFQIIVS